MDRRYLALAIASLGGIVAIALACGNPPPPNQPADRATPPQSTGADIHVATVGPAADAGPESSGSPDAGAEATEATDAVIAEGSMGDSCADASSEMQDRLMPLWDACYQKASKKKRLAGAAVVEIVVDQAGMIGSVLYKGSTDWGKTVTGCMTKATRTIRFDGLPCAGRMITARKEYRGEL